MIAQFLNISTTAVMAMDKLLELNARIVSLKNKRLSFTVQFTHVTIMMNNYNAFIINPSIGGCSLLIYLCVCVCVYSC